jgi:AAA domain-containing protein
MSTAPPENANARLVNGRRDELTGESIYRRANNLQAGKDGTLPLSISIRSPGEILAMRRPEDLNFLGDRVFAKGQSLVIAGCSGIGKSRLLFQLAVASIVGRPWCGLETHARERRWLIIQTENANSRLQDEFQQLKKWAGEDWLLVDDNLFVHTLETDDDFLLHLSDPQNALRLETAIKRIDPDIVAFDPLRDFGVGDLNSDADMANTVRELSRISRIGNPARGFIVLHHSLTGRAGAAKAFGIERTSFGRNSKVLHTWARGFINVIPGAEDDNETLILTCGKNSNGKEFPPVAVRLNPETMIYEVDLDFDIDAWREHVVSGKATRKFSADMLRDLKFQELEIKPLAKLITDQIGCGRSRAYELIREGKKKNILRFNELTETYEKI